MQLKFSFPGDRDDRFETFAIDEANREAVALCRAFVENNGVGPRSLILHGIAGSGKTHLLTAMGRLHDARHEKKSSLYLDAGWLRQQVNAAQCYEELKSRLAGYESASFLAVDNLEQIMGEREAEDQVFHLYNAVTQPGGRFAAAVRAAPSTWKFADWLATRLLWGQVVALAPVGDDRRVEALIKMAADLRMTLPSQAAQWLLTRLPRDPATQREALRLIDQRSLTTGRKVSISLMKEALERFHAP